jgi:PiT family inorganic phosphate transporter
MSMTAASLLLTGLGFALAFANGANDVSKGIATLVGSGVADYRRAILWGTAWTATGGLLSASFAGAMVATFGSGLIAEGTSQTLNAGAATLAGATAWVVIATRTGLPVSTTHAIVGSLTGVAAVAYGAHGVRWDALGSKVVLPLLVTPALSLALVFLLLARSRPRNSSGPQGSRDCVCAEWVSSTKAVTAPLADPVSLLETASLRVTVDTTESCAVERPAAARLTLDHLHWLTSGAAGFARGMNDAPKIVALVVAATALHGQSVVNPMRLSIIVTAGMVAGSLAAGRRVTRVLAEDVTNMDHREGFFANLVTAGLVGAGATFGLPMSTTHVASGGIVGAGLQRSSLNGKTLQQIGLAWIVTLPAAALLGVAAWLLGGGLEGGHYPR